MSRLTRGLFTSNTDEWATPQAVFDELNSEFHFTLDPCATPDNAKCPKFYTKDANGLLQNWGGAKRVLQSTIRNGNQTLGAEMLGGKPKAEYASGYAHTCKDRYGVLSRLYLPQGRDPFHQRPSAFR